MYKCSSKTEASVLYELKRKPKRQKPPSPENPNEQEKLAERMPASRMQLRNNHAKRGELKTRLNRDPEPNAKNTQMKAQC